MFVPPLWVSPTAVNLPFHEDNYERGSIADAIGSRRRQGVYVVGPVTSTDRAWITPHSETMLRGYFAGFGTINVSALSEARIHEGSVLEHGGPARFR
jgi:hypothetical protein